ncbi:PREDICTED: microtubule-associated protein futsch isoform X2 [Wasmannia auropunctata]|uniref:microtubule-associated protein futsch isoform X2 n=1 Tax=Wasmannia auropunctata TaxID=64793 RepID=UPI0005ED9865|nr:PREDICTED: microtubule-associated protein futsch isoform X2 [Wasmannia auropunctata]
MHHGCIIYEVTCFLSWDKDSCHVDLEKELSALVAQAPEGEEARNGERLIQYATENLVTEVLIHPQTNTLLQCIRNLLASFTKHRHIIHAGYTFGGNGSWILQDGTFSLADFLDAFSEHEVQRVLRAYENSVTVDIHCAGVGDWTTSRLSKEACCRSCRSVRVNPDDVLTAGVPAIMSFTNYIGQYLVPQTLDQLMEPSDVVGNIRFSHPTLYVFPGGQGDAALFGINGFNMLVDGGFARKACFWDFTRHLDRLDAVLVTRINNSNIGGMFSVLHKKKEMHVYPQIGHFFCNLVERRQSNSPDGDKDIDPLVLNLTDIGQEMVMNLRHVNLRAHPCYRDPNPINLYHKVGHGTLDMYVLSPSKDSREVREFLAKWHTSDSKLFAGSHKKDSNTLTFPIQNLVSICALLVWQPANPEDNITRILFPGSTPQHKIFEGFERLKRLDFLKHPVCSAKTLSPSVSLTTLKPAKQKFSLIEKEPKKISEPKKEKREPSEPKSIKAADETVSKSIPQSTPIISTSKLKTEPIKTKKVVENKKLEIEAKESKKIEKELKEIKKEPKKEPIKVEKPEKREDDVKKIDLIKSEPEKTKEPKPKPEPKKKEPKESKVKVELKKSEVTPKPKPIEKKAKPSGAEKRDAVKSSPTTPKKTLNGAATKTELSKAVPKAKPAAKVAPSLPAKSAKEANNRKVVEQKKSEVEKSAVKDTAAPIVKVSAKPKPMDRKPIVRRAKPISPNKARLPGSPAKSTRSTPTASVKSDKDGVIRKVKGDKGTTDSSTVSTPSGIEPEAVKPIDKSLVEQSEDMSLDSIESKVLADLKEEREVVEEIEAVLQKAERIEDKKDDRFEGDDEITAEADKKEEDITEEDVTAEIEDVPKKESSRKESQELTEEDEYLIVEKEEVYTEDSAQSGEGEQKHVLDEAQSEKAKILKDVEAMKEKGEKEEPEEKGKDDSPEKKAEKIVDKKEKEIAGLSSEHKEQLQEEVKEIIASAAEIVQKAEEKDESGKKDSEEITKEPSSLSPDKLDSSEKKTTDTDMKPDADQKENILEKMEESQERISTIESGATTTAPTLPEDERIPLDEIKEDIDEKHVIEEVKEKDAPAKLKKEVVPETVFAAAKPEVKVFDVRQATQNLQRDIVKTPDEVADLPVHEEVDPKLYRMDDFEKRKEEKPSPTAQESKEPPTPTGKEQKGVFSFFGKVADKFEKGIDKLTKKKKDSEKDSDEKSSSKSSSPKEPKVQEKVFLEEVDMEKMFPKVGKPTDKPETFEEVKPTIADVKVAAIKETATFIQEEIMDAQRRSVPDIEEKLPADKLDEIKIVEAISPAKLIDDKEIAKEIELLKEEDVGEDVEEVKALLEEASKKFKTVKDSLRDSLESLEDKIKEEIAEVHETPAALKDAVKDTLAGVAEKLEEIKPHIESHLPDIKEPEKVKFAIPKDEEFEEEYEEEIEGPYRDMKEAVRDVGEVLAGVAGIELEEKPKDVEMIVKKVAEVLREDDFLSDKTLFDQEPKKEETSPISTDRKPSKEEIAPISAERKPSVSGEKSPEKVAKLEEEEIWYSKLAHAQTSVPHVPVHEAHEEFIEKLDKLVTPYEKPGAIEVKEEPFIKVVREKDDIVTSPVKDTTKDKQDAQKICAEILKDDQHVCDQHKKSADDDTSRMDVMQAGIEDVCVKKVAKRPSFEERLEDEEIEEPVIGFEQKVSPAKAEIVMVTPGSTPTSPKFVVDKIYGEGLEIGFREPPKLPEDIKQILSREAPIEETIEELIITKKKKITIEVIEYITVMRRIPRERVIYIIEEIIIKKGLPRESVVDDPKILSLKESITPEKRMEIEEYIVNEYIVKGKRITIEVIQEISIKKVVPTKFVVEIIEEIIVKRKIARHMILDVPEEVLSEIVKEKSPEESPEQSAEEQITPKIDITAKRESVAEVPSAQKRAEVEEFIVNEYVIKGKKITASTIDEISAQKIVPKRILIEIIEEIVIKKKIPRNTLLDVTEGKLLTLSEKTPEDEKENLVAEIPKTESITSQKRAEVEEFIVNEYVTKGDNINVKKLEEICGKKKVPKRIIIEIIEEIIIKRKMPRHAVLSITAEELSRIIEEVAIPEPQILAEKSIAEVPSSEEIKIPIELKKDKKEDERETSTDEELSALSEEEDVEEEVDGFVSIPRRISDATDAKKKAISDISPAVTKEHEKDVIDDFEAVEQEYKVRDVPVTSPDKADEMKEKEDVEESVEDTTSEVIEADEKFVQETKGKVGEEEPQITKDIKPADGKRKEREASETSDIAEKYLDEAKEKTDFSDKGPSIDIPDISKSITPSPEVIDEKLGIKEIEPAVKEKVEEPQLKAKEDKSKPTSPIKDEILKDTVHSIEKVPEKVAEGAKPKTKLTDATGFTQEPKVELLEDDKKSKLLETVEIKETPVTKEEKSPQEISAKIDDGTVKRMLVTSCSEDGREETEICPTGSITFMKTVTPDDSLKDASVKSTPDKDSLILDKDSHSGMSTPEKDSISEKSAPEGKDKISPDDSLEKSPVGPRDSQDLEDSLEKSESRKPQMPEKLKDITKPKSPVEKDDLKDKIAEKDISKSPKEEREELKSPDKGDAGKIEKVKSPPEEKLEKPGSPIEKIEKSRTPSPLDMTTQKSPIESVEKPKLPVEKVLPEPKKEGTIGVPKTPESLHSEDISPADTIFSKSPTDKPEMYFSKAPITEEDVADEEVIKKLSESIKEIKPAVDKELPLSLEKSEQDIKSLDKSPSVLSDKVDERETDKPKSPSIIEKETISEKLPIFESEHYDKKGPIDEARSPSAISDKSDERKEAKRSKSPSIAADKPDLQDVTERYLEKPKSPIFDRPDSPKAIDKTEESHDKDRSPSVASDKSDSKKVSDRSRSPSVTVEKIDIKDVDLPIEKTRSPSATSVKDDKLEQSPAAKSPEVPKSPKSDKDKSDLKDIMQSDKSRSPSVTSGISEPKEPDRSKSPSIAGEKPDIKDVAEIADRSKSPSVTGEKPDLKDVTAEKSRSSSITGEQKEFDRSKSPSIAEEKPDLKDVMERSDEKSKSPIAISDLKGLEDRSKSPSSADLTDITEQSLDKSKSPSIASITSDHKESAEKAKSPIPDKKGEPDRSKSPSMASEKSDGKKSADGSRATSVTEEKPDLKDVMETPADKSRSSSVASERAELFGKSTLPTDKLEPPVDRSRSSSVASDKSDDKGSVKDHDKSDKSPSPQPTEKIDDDRLKTGTIGDLDFVDKTRSLSIISDKTEPKSDVSKSLSSIDDKDQKDKSRSSSVASERPDDIKIPEAKGERSTSPSLDTGKTAKDESAKSSRASSPVDKTPKDRSRSQSVFDVGEKTPTSRSRTASLFEDKLSEKLLPQEEKDASISHLDMDKPFDEKDECKKGSKSPTTSPETIEKKMQKIREKRFADFKEPDVGQPSKIEKSDDEEEDVVKVTSSITTEKKMEIEKYILDEFIMRNRKISLTMIERLVMMYSVPQFIVMEIIEDIINRQNIPRSAVFDFVDDEASFEPQYEKEEKPFVSTGMDFGRVDVTQEYIHGKPGDTTRGEGPDGKISPVGSDRYDRDSKAALSASRSLSPEIPSDKSTQDSPRSEPHIDEEILLSEEKRMEIEKLLEEEYIKKGKKITEVVLEEIIVKTSLPRYIILEIVEEIVMKRKIPRESVIDVEIYPEEEPDEAMYRYEEGADVDYELPHDARKSSVEYKIGMYPESSERQMDKSDYPTDYESQFHKAFVGGMTEMRTTHITTLSGKSTPEFTHDATSVAGKALGKIPESTLTTTHITKTDVEDTKTAQPAQTITILRESKIAETIDKPEETAGISATITSDEKSGKTIEVMKIIEEVEPQEIVKEVKRLSTQQDEPEAITKIITREIVEHDEPEVITKVVKREIIEQDEPEIITKVIRREIVVPDEETDDSKEDSGEYVKTITTRTIVTEELPDTELTQTDPLKIYTDPSDTIYKVVSDEDASDATTSADVKRIVTTVTTITGPDGKVITKKDVKESTDTLASEELLEKLTETTSAEKIIKETITTVTSGTATPDVKAFYDSGKSTPDLKQETKLESTIKERLDADKFEHPVSPLIRELISDDKSYSGKSSPDISLPKDIVFSGKSTPDIPMSPLIRDGAVVQPHVSGRSTPDRKSDGRSSTATPEGFRSGEMIRTIVTTTKTVSDEGEIVTTTREVTETTNEKGETVVLAEKTDVKVDERLPSKDAAESAISSIIGSIKSSELQRSGSSGSDIISEKDRGPPNPSSEHSSKVVTQPWGSSEERHTYSDDEPPSSPLSSTSQVGYSPQATRRYESASDKQEEQMEFSAAAMSSSFYGELPAVPPEISAMKTFHGETGMQKDSDPISVHRFTVEKEPVGDYGEKPDAKKYVDEADLDFDKALMDKEMKEAGGAFSSGISPRYTNGNVRHEPTDEKDHPSSSFRDDAKDDSKGDSKKDPLEGWGTPLGLPSPKPPRKFNLKNPAQSPSCSTETTSDTLNFDVIKNWGEPLRLPSPAPVTNEVSNKGAPSTPKKERKQAKKVQSENIKNKKRSESPGKNEKKMKDSKNKIQPVYMDLAYVPHHGNSYYTSLEFFKRVRARYYVFSGTEPSREVYDALLEAKKTWEDKDLEVTMIPTYDTDTLGYWVADNEEALAANHIDLSPSASRCTINLQDHETSCSAYRLEF